MWTPTHVQVTVLRARNLIPKGKGGTNDAYVTIALAKEKYQTSVKEKSDHPEWHEECDLPIPDSKTTIQLNAYHRNLLGLDEFLGHAAIPLEQFQIYERPRARWYPLKNKAGSKKAEKYRGEIEVKVTFIVQSLSASDLNLAKSGKVKRAGSTKSLLSDKLHVKFPSKSNLFHQGSKSDLYADKKQPFPSEHLPNSPHETTITVFQSQEVLPTEFRASTPEGADKNDDDEHKISNLDRERFETSRDSSDSSPKLFKRPPLSPRLHELKSELGPDSPLSSSTSSLTRDYPRHCHPALAQRRNTGTPLAQSMLDLSVGHADHSPGSSPHFAHHTTDLQRSSSNASSKSDDDEFSRFSRKRQPVLRSSLKGKKSSSDSGCSTGSTRSGLSLDGVEPSRRSSTHSNDSSPAHMLGSLPEESASRDNTPGAEQKPLPQSDAPSDPQQPSPLRPLAEQLEAITPSEIKLEETNKRRSLTEIEKKENERNATEKSKPVVEKKAAKRETSKRSKDDFDLDLEVSRRHTMGHGMRENAKVMAHELHEMTTESKKPKDTSLPDKVLDQYADYSREELIRMVVKQRAEIKDQDQYIKDMEDYIDRLLVKVMETSPKLLQNPFERAQMQGRSIPTTASSPTAATIPSSSSPLNNRTVEMTRNNTSIIHPNLTQSLKITNQTTPKIMNADSNKLNMKSAPAKNSAKRTSNPFKKLQAALK